MGFESSSRVFRTTYGAYDTHTVDLMRELFDLSIAGIGTALGTNLHVSDLSTVGFVGGDDYEYARTCIDAAAEYDQLLGLTIHMARMESRSAFESLVEYVADLERRGELKVVTPTQFLDEQLYL
jgi:hypothetical protein